jgi:hypothetical protein
LAITSLAVTGPRDVIGDSPVGVLNEDLRAACLGALEISRKACLAFAADHTWEASAHAFLDNVRRVSMLDADRLHPHGAKPHRMVA